MGLLHRVPVVRIGQSYRPMESATQTLTLPIQMRIKGEEFMLADRAMSESDQVRCVRHDVMIPPPPDLRMDYLQLTPATVQGEGYDLVLPGFMLRSCRTQTTIGASGCGGLERHIFVFLSNLKGEGRLNGRPLLEGLTFLSGTDPFEARLPPMDMMGLAVSRDLLDDYLETVEGVASPWMGDGIHFFGSPKAVSASAGLIREMLARLEADPAALLTEEGRNFTIWSILDRIVPAIVDSRADMATDYRLPNRYKIVRRTREYILDRIDEPLQISTVCRDLGVSRRALQYSFQDVLNINPVAFMRMLRLNGARRDLVEMSEARQVKDVIDRWGFWHPSRFSGEYKQMFHELPSDTLRRSRAST